MTERVQRVTQLGYTESQARFLELAALDSGYFVRSQFNDFLERECGALAQVFIERGLEKGHIASVDGFRNCRIYHTVGHALFRALGDENNRNRRVHQPATIRRRLMSLNYCLAVRGGDWLLTEREKLKFFEGRRVTEMELPAEMFGGARRYFVEKQPILVGPQGAPSFAFIDEGLKSLSQWELFLRGHRKLIQRIEQATIVFAGTQPERFVPAERLFQKVVTGTSSSGSFDLARLVRYFEARKQFETRQYSGFDQLRLDQFREDRRVFAGERVEALYAQWSTLGENALAPISASGITFRTHLFKNGYEWISPVYGERKEGVRCP